MIIASRFFNLIFGNYSPLLVYCTYTEINVCFVWTKKYIPDFQYYLLNLSFWAIKLDYWLFCAYYERQCIVPQ